MTDVRDTGMALRSLYEPEGGVRSVFSSKVADYMGAAAQRLRAIFQRFRQDEAVRVRYRTILHLGRPG